MVNALGAIGGAGVVSVVIKAIDETTGVFKKVNANMLAAGAAITGVGVAGAIALKGLANDASDLKESVNAVQVVFGDAADIIQNFGKTSASSVGLATAEFNQMSAVTGALLKDVGIPMSDVANMTNDLSQRAADMASVFNTDVSDAMSAINQAIRGETEAIRRYAGDVTDATLQTYLNSKGIGKNVKELTQQEKRLYRVQLIMEQTSDTTGDFANTSDSLANRQRVLNATMVNLRAEMGTALLPVFEYGIGIVQKLVSWFSNLSDGTKKFIVIGAALVVALGLIIGPLLIIVALIPTITTAVGILGVAFTVLTGPIGLVIAAVAALIAIGVLLYKNWDVVKDKMTKVWEGIKNVTKSSINFMIGLVEGYVNMWIRAANIIIKALNRIQVNIPEWVPGIGGRSYGINLPTISSIALPRLAKGGIVTRPTVAMVGENGPEAVVPLKEGKSYGNTIININGPINGITGKDIANQLQKELKKRVNIGT